MQTWPSQRAPAQPRLGLHADYGVAVLNAGDHDLALIEHGRRNVVLQLTGRIAPGLTDTVLYLRCERIEPFLVVLFGLIGQNAALGHDLLDGSPAELGDGFSVHDGLDQLFACGRSVFQRIALCRHPVHDAGHALDGIQMRAAAYGCLHRGAGIVMQDEGHLSLAYRLLGQIDPLLHPAGELLAALDDGRPLQNPVPVLSGGDDDRLDHALKLRHGHRPSDIV